MLDPAAMGPRDAGRRSRPLLRTNLGNVLRRTRLSQGRTLADVCRAAKVSMPYLSELERGRKEASSEILAAICAALSIELADLLTLVGRDLVGDRFGPAPVGPDLVEFPTEPAQVIRLGTEPGASGPSPLQGSGDVVCLLAA